MAACIVWRLGIRQFSFHHIPRVPQHLAPVRLGTTAAFLGEVGTQTRCLVGPFPASPLPNPPCEFPRNGLSSDYVVSDAVGCSVWMAWWQAVQTTRVLRRRFAMSLTHAGCDGPGWPRSASLRMWCTTTSSVASQISHLP